VLLLFQISEYLTGWMKHLRLEEGLKFFSSGSILHLLLQLYELALSLTYSATITAPSRFRISIVYISV
jgi:hypothetical protein